MTKKKNQKAVTNLPSPASREWSLATLISNYLKDAERWKGKEMPKNVREDRIQKYLLIRELHRYWRWFAKREDDD